MGQHLSNIDAAAIIVNGSNQPRLVAANIKNGKFADLIGAGEYPAQFHERRHIHVSHDSIPSRKRTSELRVFLREIH